jgi:hypothetical protein
MASRSQIKQAVRTPARERLVKFLKSFKKENTAKKQESEQPPAFEEHPPFDFEGRPAEIWRLIFSELFPGDIANLRKVSRSVRNFIDSDKNGDIYQKTFRNLYHSYLSKPNFNLFQSPFWMRWRGFWQERFRDKTEPEVVKVSEALTNAALPFYHQEFANAIENHKRRREQAEEQNVVIHGSQLQKVVKELTVTLMRPPFPIIETCFGQIEKFEHPNDRRFLIKSLIIPSGVPPQEWLNLAANLVHSIKNPETHRQLIKEIAYKAKQPILDKLVKEHALSVEEIGRWCMEYEDWNASPFNKGLSFDHRGFHRKILESISSWFPEETDRLSLLLQLGADRSTELEVSRVYRDHLSDENHRKEVRQLLRQSSRETVRVVADADSKPDAHALLVLRGHQQHPVARAQELKSSRAQFI